MFYDILWLCARDVNLLTFRWKGGRQVGQIDTFCVFCLLVETLRSIGRNVSGKCRSCSRQLAENNIRSAKMGKGTHIFVQNRSVSNKKPYLCKVNK